MAAEVAMLVECRGDSLGVGADRCVRPARLLCSVGAGRCARPSARLPLSFLYDSPLRWSTLPYGRAPARAAAYFITVILLLITPDGLAQQPEAENPKASPGFVIENLAAPDATETESRFDSLRALAQKGNWTDLAEQAAGLLAASDDRGLHYWLGIARLQLGNFVPAAMELRAAERLGMADATLHKALGIAYYRLRQYKLFQEQMRRAMAADPADAEPHHYLGRYHELDLNDFTTALSYFEQALALDSNDVKSHHFRAVCFEMLDRRAEAKQAYRTAMEMVEQQGKSYSWPFERFALLVLGEEPQQALPYARKAVALEPSRVENRLLLAKIRENLDQPEAALPQLLAAAQLRPNDRSIRYVLFRIYRKLGKKEDAARELALHEKLKTVYGTSQQ